MNKIKLLVNEKLGGLDTLWGIFHRVVAVATCPPEFRLSSVSRNILHVLDITYGFIAVDKAAGSRGDVFVRCGECFQDVHVSDLVRPSSVSSILVCPSSNPPSTLPLSLSISHFLCTAEETWTVPSFCEYHTHTYGFATSPAYEQKHTQQRLLYCMCWIIFGVKNWGSLGETDSLNTSRRHEEAHLW